MVTALYPCGCSAVGGDGLPRYCPLHRSDQVLRGALEQIFRRCSLGPATFPRLRDSPAEKERAELYNLVVFAGETARTALAAADKAREEKPGSSDEPRS